MFILFFKHGEYIIVMGCSANKQLESLLEDDLGAGIRLGNEHHILGLTEFILMVTHSQFILSGKKLTITIGKVFMLV